jgi:hypothetical protein
MGISGKDWRMSSFPEVKKPEIQEVCDYLAETITGFSPLFTGSVLKSLDFNQLLTISGQVNKGFESFLFRLDSFCS